MQPYNNPKLDSLAVSLFKEFARFEYALKAANFHSGDGDADPNWRRFALSIEDSIANPQSPGLRKAVEYMLAHPPKKQVVRHGLLAWDVAVPTTDSRADLVLLYVRRVRNNLFHGGKFNGHWFEPERSEELLHHSLVILDACLAASSDVREAYNQ